VGAAGVTESSELVEPAEQKDRRITEVGVDAADNGLGGVVRAVLLQPRLSGS
jgi:hypothetical protein